MLHPDQLLLSDLLHCHVYCEQGVNRGIVVMGWMHPPAHRLLGWASSFPTLPQQCSIWRLNQCIGMHSQEVYARGKPAKADSSILDQLPTLVGASLLNREGKLLGQMVDLACDISSGRIIHYLVARSNPRLPGGSRWRLSPNHIIDQQLGQITSDLLTLDDLPLAHASFRQDLLLRSRRLRKRLQLFRNRTTQRLEGWLDEPPWESTMQRDMSAQHNNDLGSDSLEAWHDENWVLLSRQPQRTSRPNNDSELGEPWI